MATVEVAEPAALIAREEQIKTVEEAVKVSEIEPTTEKALDKEFPASSPAKEVPVTEKIVDESPTTGEDSAHEITVTPPATPPASEAEAETGQLESEEEAAQVPEEGDPAKEVSVADAPPETAKADEKGEEFSAKGEAPADVPEEKVAIVEESTVREEKLAEAVPAEEKAQDEGKGEE